MSRLSPHWSIVGGGALGLALAMRLAARGDEVTIIEAADHLGGLADAWTIGDVRWDRHYHVILPVDRSLIALLAEIGLGGEIVWARPESALFDGTRTHSLNNGLDYLRLPILSLADKARLALTILYGSRIRNGAPLEDVGVEDWLTRLSGRRVFDVLWRPLLQAKLGDNYRRASAAFIWSIIRRMYGARAAGVARDQFGTVRGGYDTIIGGLEQALRAKGVRIHLQASVRGIERHGNGWRVAAGGEAIDCDRVVVTTPPGIAADMLTVLGEDERDALRGIPYQGVICVSMLLTRALGGAYMTYILDRACPLTTVINMSAVAGEDAFGGRTLCYLPAYLPSDSALFDEDDASLVRRFTAGLRQLHPHITDADIEAVRVSRARHVLPIPVKGYSRRLPPMLTSQPGLHVVNSAHIVGGTLNVNETIELADRALAEFDANETGDLTASPLMERVPA